MTTVLVTGSSGLVGSACVRHFDALGWVTHGLDNHARAHYFGPDGDVTPTTKRLVESCRHFTSHYGDVRSRRVIDDLFFDHRFDAVVHAAAQPSHDHAATDPRLDFEVNAVGTLNLLEAARFHSPRAAFVFLSTNKVYGDNPNRASLVELSTRYDLAVGTGFHGFDETLDVDQTTHSLFGCSKLAADMYVQEYGRYYGLPTCCLRAGCLTGGGQAGAVQHGFLAYLARCCKEGRPYTVFGHKGKQVRDQLHADDVARACELFIREPRTAETYNLGGGRGNSVSVLEAIELLEQATGKQLDWRYEDKPRRGDHCVYYSDTRKFRSHYPDWSVTRSLESIVEELCRQEVAA